MIEKLPADKNAKATEEEMRKYGVRRSSVDCFHVGRYRYSDLNDAMAQARRVKPKPYLAQ